MYVVTNPKWMRFKEQVDDALSAMALHEANTNCTAGVLVTQTSIGAMSFVFSQAAPPSPFPSNAVRFWSKYELEQLKEHLQDSPPYTPLS